MRTDRDLSSLKGPVKKVVTSHRGHTTEVVFDQDGKMISFREQSIRGGEFLYDGGSHRLRQMTGGSKLYYI